MDIGEDQKQDENLRKYEKFRRCYRSRSFHEHGQFPPTIPLLSQTGNSSVHMPWVLQRSYTDNGRLVLKEVKTYSHQCFRAHRSNGRLTLRLMHLEDPVSLPGLASENSTESNDKGNGNAIESPPSPSSSPDEEKKEKGKREEYIKDSKNMFKLHTSYSFASLASLHPPKEEKKERRSLFKHDSLNNRSEVLRVSSMPSISSLVPELFTNKIPNSKSSFQMPLLPIRPVHS